jgi:hypothetical protein
MRLIPIIAALCTAASTAAANPDRMISVKVAADV